MPNERPIRFERLQNVLPCCYELPRGIASNASGSGLRGLLLFLFVCGEELEINPAVNTSGRYVDRCFMTPA